MTLNEGTTDRFVRLGPGAGEQPAPAAAADGNGSQPPGQGQAGAALLAASVAGAVLAPLALRRPGRGGSLLVAAGCGALFARDAQMTLTGAPARLRPLPRLLLLTEVPVSLAHRIAKLADRNHSPVRAWTVKPIHYGCQSY